MLYIALVMSAVLLVGVNLAALRPSRRVLATSLCGLVLALGSISVEFVYFPFIVFQAALLLLVGAVWKLCRGEPRWFLLVSVGLSIAIYGIFGVFVVDIELQNIRLREKHPYESIEGRVPFLLTPSKQAPIHDTASLETLESGVIGEVKGYRAFIYRQLHEQTVSEFIRRPNFGFRRLPLVPSEQDLNSGLRDQPPPHQPGSPAPTRPVSSQSSGELSGPAGTKLLNDLHTKGVLDFVHPNGFGFVKDRAHVAGFQSHGFSKVPKASAKWEVARLELVSLLLHQEPVVYVSERLPSMTEVRGAPTRPLDRFESDGLAALRNGEDLHIAGTRMVGSIRATKQCLECHGGSRGGLLGAFSYVLRLAGE